MSFTHPDELHVAFAEAFQAGDVRSLLDLYEAGAVQVHPDGTKTDRDGLAEVFTQLLASGVTLHGDPQKAVVAGDLALTSTRYTIDDSDRPGGSRTVATAEVSRRQPDGSWRVVIDVPSFV